MTKDIKIKYNSLLINEIQASYSRIQDFLFWCPGGIGGGISLPDEGVPGHSGGWYGSKPAEPNCMNGAFSAAFFGGDDTPESISFILPEVEYGYFTHVDFFFEKTHAILGVLDGRGLAVNGSTVYLQESFGSDDWEVVATTNTVMEPAFIHISPSGDKIVIGEGWEQDVLVFPLSILSATGPPVLDTHPNTTVIPVNHYDAVWFNDQYLLVNGGLWPGSPYESTIICIDVDAVTGAALITDIPGASSGLAFDSDGNLITGIGYHSTRTGELKLWNAVDISDAIYNYTSYQYDGAEGKILAEEVLSAAALGIDYEGHLHVGGGQYEEQNPVELGFAVFIHSDVSYRVNANDGSLGFALDKSPGIGEYKTMSPDDCMDDSATFIVANTWGEAVAVVWNPDEVAQLGGTPCTGVIGQDLWYTCVIPNVQFYYSASIF